MALKIYTFPLDTKIKFTYHILLEYKQFPLGVALTWSEYDTTLHKN